MTELWIKIIQCYYNTLHGPLFIYLFIFFNILTNETAQQTHPCKIKESQKQT